MRKRSPFFMAVDVGAALQLFAASEVPSSVPRSLLMIVERFPCESMRSMTHWKPAFVAIAPSLPQRLKVMFPEIVMS
jgi:hypothetical protein